jgi:FlaA1/EpsC-like NDP-sugar epimerase
MDFTEEQERIIQCFTSGKNIFITGAGGTGKSEIIQYFPCNCDGIYNLNLDVLANGLDSVCFLPSYSDIKIV